MTTDAAILTAITASDDWQRTAAIESIRHNPFVQMIGREWRGARLLIQTEAENGENMEDIVSGIRSYIERASGVRYRRDA